MANLEVFERKVLGNELKCCFRKKPNNSPLHLPIKLMCSCQLSRKLENREKKNHPSFTVQRKLLGFDLFLLVFFFSTQKCYIRIFQGEILYPPSKNFTPYSITSIFSCYMLYQLGLNQLDLLHGVDIEIFRFSDCLNIGVLLIFLLIR